LPNHLYFRKFFLGPVDICYNIDHEKKLNSKWQQWLANNLKKGVDSVQLCCILVQNNYSLNATQDAMGEHFPKLIRIPGASIPEGWRNWVSVNLGRMTEYELTKILLRDKFSIIETYKIPGESFTPVKSKDVKPFEYLNPDYDYQRSAQVKIASTPIRIANR
jgi:hypothetical protein